MKFIILLTQHCPQKPQSNRKSYNLGGEHRIELELSCACLVIAHLLLLIGGKKFRILNW